MTGATCSTGRMHAAGGGRDADLIHHLPGEAQGVGGGEKSLVFLQAQERHVLRPGQFQDAQQESLQSLVQSGGGMHHPRHLLHQGAEHQFPGQEILILVVFGFLRLEGHFPGFPLVCNRSDYTTNAWPTPKAG